MTRGGTWLHPYSWWRRPRARHRITIRKRTARTLSDTVDVVFTGRRWTWSCSCDYVLRPCVDQRTALDLGCVHLRTVHR